MKKLIVLVLLNVSFVTSAFSANLKQASPQVESPDQFAEVPDTMLLDQEGNTTWSFGQRDENAETTCIITRYNSVGESKRVFRKSYDLGWRPSSRPYVIVPIQIVGAEDPSYNVRIDSILARGGRLCVSLENQGKTTEMVWGSDRQLRHSFSVQAQDGFNDLEIRCVRPNQLN